MDETEPGLNGPPGSLLAALLARSAARHRHLCPRQVLGARLGLSGLRLLGLVGPDYGPPFINQRKRLLVFAEMDGCGLDGLAVATDCEVGHRTLRVLDYGKVAATLVCRRTGEAVRVAVRPGARELASQYAPGATSRWHAYLAGYQVMPDGELLRAERVRLTESLERVISRPAARAICQQCGEEILNERQLIRDGRLLCRACAGDSYYRVIPP
jgi:formylmethanofuran dehydrogenase subunit E